MRMSVLQTMDPLNENTMCEYTLFPSDNRVIIMRIRIYETINTSGYSINAEDCVNSIISPNVPFHYFARIVWFSDKKEMYHAAHIIVTYITFKCIYTFPLLMPIHCNVCLYLHHKHSVKKHSYKKRFYKSSRFGTSIWKMYSAVRFPENSSQSHKLLRYISLKNVSFGDFIHRAFCILPKPPKTVEINRVMRYRERFIPPSPKRFFLTPTIDFAKRYCNFDPIHSTEIHKLVWKVNYEFFRSGSVSEHDLL